MSKFFGSLKAEMKNFRNAKWFRRHPYAWFNILKQKWNQRVSRPYLSNAELCFDVGCNYQCVHCSISSFQKDEKYKKTMTVTEIVRVARELRSLDCFLCCIVGGEPTFRDDLPEIISVFDRNRILPTIITNGFRIDESYMRRLKTAGLFSIGFSMNGLDARSH